MRYDDDWDDPEDDWTPETPAPREFCCYWNLECEDLECGSGTPDPDHEDLHDISLERAVADDGG
jgi:hypothetical protein